MKKMYVGALCVLSLLAASCQQDELVPRQDGLVTVGATMEEEVILPSRSNVTDEGIFTWYKGDQIGIWTTPDGGEAGFHLFTLREDCSGKQKGYFTTTLTGDATFSDYAIYPYHKDHSLTDGALTLHLPKEYGSKEQDYVENTNALMIAYLGTEPDMENMQFRHVGGVVCVTLTDRLPAETCGVQLVANKKITGSFTVTDATTGNPTITTADNSSEDDKSVTILFKPWTEAQAAGTKKFYFPVPTGTYKFGLKYLVNNGDGTHREETLKDINDAKEDNPIVRSQLLLLKSIQEYTFGGNMEGASTQNVASNDDVANVLNMARSGEPLNITASGAVTDWLNLSTLTADGFNPIINVTYTEAPCSLVVTKDATSPTATVETAVKGAMNFFIPATETALERVVINTPELEITINEGKADVVKITALTVTSVANLSLGSGVQAGNSGYAVSKDNNINTYTVYTADGLQAVNDLVIEDLTANVILAADIDLSYAQKDENGSNWKAIKDPNKEPYSYQGTFNGNNHTIKGLTINATTANQGLIGSLGSTGKVENVTLIDCKIESTSYNVGGIAGKNYGKVSNCDVGGNSAIKSTFPGNASEKTQVGGIVGANAGDTNTTPSIENCEVRDNVEISGVERVGGIVGYNSGGTSSVKDCSVNNAVTVKGSTVVGGIAGRSTGTIDLCKLTGTVSVEATGEYAGGIVGFNTASVSNCAAGDMSKTYVIKGTNYVSGIVASNQDKGTIINCTAAKCTVIGTGCFVGAVAGVSLGKIYGSTAQDSNVTGAYWVGGVLGENKGALVASYAKNVSVSMTSTDTKRTGTIGGIVGRNTSIFNSVIIGCYAYKCTNGNAAFPIDYMNVVGTRNSVESGGKTYYGAVTGCYYYASDASGAQVIPVTASSENGIASAGTAANWSDAVTAMNNAISAYDAEPKCTYQWAENKTYSTSALKVKK